MSGRWQEQERWQEFGSITVAQRMVRKRGEEGLYLYPKRQSEGTWMNSKCQIHKQKSKSQEWVHHLGFEN
jgi:hypothetical protein